MVSLVTAQRFIYLHCTAELDIDSQLLSLLILQDLFTSITVVRRT